MKRLLLFFSALLMGISGAWASTHYFVTGPTQVTDLSTLSSSKYYILQNNGSSGYIKCDGSQLIMSSTFDYNSVVQLDYDNTNVTIKQVSTGTYYQLFTDQARVTLGASSANFTFNTEGCASGLYRIANGSIYMNRDDGDNYPKGHTGTGDYSKWKIYEVSIVEIADDVCYKINFISHDGTKTWGLKSGTTEQKAVENGDGDVYVAHSYTNLSGEERWIFVNNSDGTYLAYHGQATTEFDIENPISEFSIEGLWAGKSGYTATGADYSNKVCIINDKRYTNNESLGCYILKETNGNYDNSAAPYFNYKNNNNDYFTSALTFTATGASVTSTASLAIAKFDALNEVRGYLPYASNISALFDSPTSIKANINAAATAEAAATVATNFMKSPEGKKFYAVNSTATSQFLNVTTSEVSATSTNLSAAAVMEVEYAGSGKYYLKGVESAYYACSPVNGNDAPATVSSTSGAGLFYIGNYGNTTDNKVYFAKSKSGGETIEAIHYNSDKTHKTCGWGYDAGASNWDITYISDDDYTILAAATIDDITASLTDMNDVEYTVTYSAALGTKPTLTGCYGYTLSDEVWDYTNRTYSATIKFPFNVSSADATNWIYIYNYQSTHKWYVESASATRVVVKKSNVPKYSDYTRYEWAVYPSISSSGAVTFTIKNHCTGKFITSSSTSDSHSGAVTLTTTGTSLTYILDGSYPRWCLPTTKDNDGTTKLELSFNSSTDTGVQELGSWHAHDLTSSWTISDIDDFAALYSSLNSAFTAFSSYRSLIGNGLGQYSGASSSSMVTTYDGIIGGADPTAAEMRTWTTTLENPATKLTINQPTAGMFLRFKSKNNNRYAKAVNNTTASAVQMQASSGDPTADNMFYFAGSKLLSYSKGLYIVNTRDMATVGTDGATFEFLESDNLGAYFIKCGGNYMYGYDKDHKKEGNLDRISTTSGYEKQCRWYLEEVTSLPVTLTNLSSYGIEGCYATFYTPVKVEIDGATAYTLSLTDGGTLRATEVENNIVPAGTGVILVGDNTSATATITSDEAQSEKGGLSGSCVAMNSPENSYIFTALTDDGGSTYTLGFFKNGFDVIPGFKAYYQSEQGLSTVRGFSISFDLNDAIADVISTLTPKSVYDLQGRRVNMSAKGLYIINGKKVIK